jgi:hypothetical protein
LAQQRTHRFGPVALGDRRKIVEPDHFPSARPVMGAKYFQYQSPRLA